jgi:hypothetical protein
MVVACMDTIEQILTAHTFVGLSGPDRPDHFQIGSVQVHEKWLAPVIFVELITRGRCISLGDNRSPPARLNFDGIVFEIGHRQYRFPQAHYIVFVHTSNILRA